MNILFIGDVVGSPGRKAVRRVLPSVKREFEIDFCIANGENTAGGTGITVNIAKELYGMGINAISMGNHVWSKKEIIDFMGQDNRIVRPANFPAGTPGRGNIIINSKCGKIALINLLGRVYMESIDCPFSAADRELEQLEKSGINVIVVDIHAEATSEKTAMGWYLDGRVSCVLGTHTHVQTADERILPKGTGFITDVGMTGPHEGIIGMNRDIIIKRFTTKMPSRFEVAEGSIQFNAVVLNIDSNTGRTLEIERISHVLSDI